jgi:hypothetical protein
MAAGGNRESPTDLVHTLAGEIGDWLLKQDARNLADVVEARHTLIRQSILSVESNLGWYSSNRPGQGRDKYMIENGDCLRAS